MNLASCPAFGLCIADTCMLEPGVRSSNIPVLCQFRAYYTGSCRAQFRQHVIKIQSTTSRGQLFITRIHVSPLFLISVC